MKKRIAIIAYDFPPLNSGGAQRPYLMASEMLKAGFDVTVFTLKADFYPAKKLSFVVDEERIKGVKIIRTDLVKEKWYQPILKGNYLTLTDEIGKRWFSSLRKALNHEHNINAFDLMLVTCPPFSLAPMGLKISKSLDIPFILDLRDAWSQWVVSPFASILHYKLLLSLERKCLEQASLVNITSNQQKEDLLRVHPNLERDKFIYVPNGFDGFKLAVTMGASEKIRIVYTGMFYYNPKSENLINKKWYKKKIYQFLQYLPRKEKWIYRSPYFFFEILNELREIDKQLFDRLEIVFAGEKPEWFDPMVDKFNLKSNILHLGFMPRNDMGKLINSSDYLLLTSSKVLGGKDYSVAGKTFEYLSYQKPILGVVCEGEQKQILERVGNSIVLNPDFISESAKLLAETLKGNRMPISNRLEIESFILPNNYNILFNRMNQPIY